MQKIIDTIIKNKIVPVVVCGDLEQGKEIIHALNDADLKIAEVTFRTSCAKEVIKICSAIYPEMLIGAGTIINGEQCLEAIKCGAKFIVSPGFSFKVYEICKEYNIFYLPGAVTPTEIMNALSLNLNFLKFFPASVYGGIKAIKSLSAPFPQVKFLPTGGIDNGNIKEYINNPKVFAIGGSYMIGDDYLTTLELTKKAISVLKD